MLRSHIGGAVLVAALLIAPQARANVMAAPQPVLEAAERTDPLGRGLVVRVADEVPDAEVIHKWIEQRGHEVLGERRALLEVRDLIRVAVRGGPYDYRITLQVRRDGRDLPDQPDPVICECGSDEMLVRIGEAIDVAADRLVVAAAQERRAEEMKRKGTERQAAQRRAELAAIELEDGRAHVSSRRRGGDAARSHRYRSTPLGVAGIALLSTGAALLVGGIGITAADGSNERGSPGGLAMIGIGSTSWLTGMTMLVVDIARCRRDPSKCDAPRGMARRSAVAARERRP
jgi:hypothetical protein